MALVFLSNVYRSLQVMMRVFSKARRIICAVQSASLSSLPVPSTFTLPTMPILNPAQIAPPTDVATVLESEIKYAFSNSKQSAMLTKYLNHLACI